MKNKKRAMKKHLLLLSALCLMSVGSVHAQSELVTDGSTPAVLAPPVRAKAPLQGLFKTCDPTVSDPTVIAGSWYAVDNSKLFLTACALSDTNNKLIQKKLVVQSGGLLFCT